jgi:hypothetical protein
MRWLVILIFWLSGTYVTALPPALEREVNIRVANEPLKEVLNRIAVQAGIQFSYNPQKIQVNKNVSVSIQHKPLRLALNILFKGTVQFKQKGNYVILSSVAVNTENAPVKKIFISGYVFDAAGQKLSDASIYNISNQLSAVTNAYGYFMMQVPADVLPITVRVSKDTYVDTLVVIQTTDNTIDILLQQQKITYHEIDTGAKSISAPVDSIGVVVLPTDTPFHPAVKNKFLENIISPKIKANLHNIKDTVFTKVQFSFVPYLSTNKLLSANAVNTFSLNVLMGYSQGVNGAEVGGLVNIDRGNVRYFQAAGLVNAVGGEVKGAQFAGLVNYNRKSLNGFQSAGLVNVVQDSVNGLQVGGLVNVCERINGSQVAGLVNATERIKGTQLAGLVNASERVTGVQVAGLVNVAEQIEGWQCSGLVNVAGKITGGQAGVFNVADSCKGIPVGFFSYVRSGYHKIELSADEILPVQFSFRSGVQQFHNIFTLGYNGFTSGPFCYAAGYGLGAGTTGKKWRLAGDVISQMLFVLGERRNAPLLTNVFVGPEYSIGKKMSLSCGPAFRMLLSYTNANTDYQALVNNLVPYTFYRHTFPAGTTVHMWVGAKISLKFL